MDNTESVSKKSNEIDIQELVKKVTSITSSLTVLLAIIGFTILRSKDALLGTQGLMDYSLAGYIIEGGKFILHQIYLFPTLMKTNSRPFIISMFVGYLIVACNTLNSAAESISSIVERNHQHKIRGIIDKFWVNQLVSRPYIVTLTYLITSIVLASALYVAISYNSNISSIKASAVDIATTYSYALLSSGLLLAIIVYWIITTYIYKELYDEIENKQELEIRVQNNKGIEVSSDLEKFTIAKENLLKVLLAIKKTRPLALLFGLICFAIIILNLGHLYANTYYLSENVHKIKHIETSDKKTNKYFQRRNQKLWLLSSISRYILIFESLNNNKKTHILLRKSITRISIRKTKLEVLRTAFTKVKRKNLAARKNQKSLKLKDIKKK